MKPKRLAELTYDYSRNRISPLAENMTKEQVIQYLEYLFIDFGKRAFYAGREGKNDGVDLRYFNFNEYLDQQA